MVSFRDLFSYFFRRKAMAARRAQQKAMMRAEEGYAAQERALGIIVGRHPVVNKDGLVIGSVRAEGWGSGISG